MLQDSDLNINKDARTLLLIYICFNLVVAEMDSRSWGRKALVTNGFIEVLKVFGRGSIRRGGDLFLHRFVFPRGRPREHGCFIFDKLRVSTGSGVLSTSWTIGWTRTMHTGCCLSHGEVGLPFGQSLVMLIYWILAKLNDLVHLHDGCSTTTTMTRPDRIGRSRMFR